jgi:hypothetical protein
MAKINSKEWKKLKARFSRQEDYKKYLLGEAEREYIHSRGMEIITLHATDFVKKRLQPAQPRNDGRQTPTKGHPVFLAQHATGTCSRKSLKEIHDMEEGVELSDQQVDYIVQIILQWIEEQMDEAA